jgi:predicted acetyltransferase
MAKPTYVSETVLELLEGKKVNLKVMEKEDLGFFVDFCNNLDYWGDSEAVNEQMTKTEAERRLTDSSKSTYFAVRKKDGTSIGLVTCYGQYPGSTTVGYAIVPSERAKDTGQKHFN